MDPALKSKIRSFVKEQQKVIDHSSSEEEIKAAFRNVHALTPHGNSDLLAEFEETEIILARKEFNSVLYELILEFLLKKLSIEWAKTALVGLNHKLFEDIFLCGSNPTAALCALGHCIAENGPGYRLNKCTHLVQLYLEKNQLQLLLLEHTGASTDELCKSVSAYRMQVWEDIVSILATLPERISNKLQSETSDVFYPDNYFPLLCNSMLVTLTNVHENLVSGRESSVQFLSLLLGKLCLSGRGEVVWNSLLASLLAQAHNDYIWCRVCERLIMGTPDRCLESVLEPLVHKIPWYGYMSKFLGHAVLNHRKVEFLLTNKLLFLRYFENDLVLRNIIGYVASSGTLKHLHVQVFLKLLDVWGDTGAVRHTSYEQHLYITKAILICAAFTKATDLQRLQSEILNKLMTGVQVHLDSSSHNVRRLGMVTSEILTERLSITDHKLKFEYEDDQETRELKGLSAIPEDPGLRDVRTGVQNLSTLTPAALPTVETPSGAVENQGFATAEAKDSDLDSDDDLEPYDLSNDVKVTKEKPPVYIRECMEGLINPENPDRVEQCLQTAEQLIRQHQQAAAEISVEFGKILLNLQDSFSLPEFTVRRHGALVALLVIAPIQVSEYFTCQVYERNYNILQRLDILQALADAAKELSSPEVEKGSKSQAALIQPLREEKERDEGRDWRQIVQERIESKTRRFGTGRTLAEKEAVASRFAPVAGDFFFPLLKNFDRVQGHLDLLGDDHVVLSRLVHTLGVILYAAQHAPICRKMGQSMLEFIWAVRYHPQAFTRQAVLFAASMVILALPPHALTTDLSAQICELKLWLEDTVAKDSDGECKKMALQALMLLERALKEEFSVENG